MIITEEDVDVAAAVLATSMMIEQPILPAECWRGLAREVLQAVADRAPALKVSAAEIDAKKTPRGGWTMATLAEWGVPWPPPPGWRRCLIAGKPMPRRLI